MKIVTKYITTDGTNSSVRFLSFFWSHSDAEIFGRALSCLAPFFGISDRTTDRPSSNERPFHPPIYPAELRNQTGTPKKVLKVPSQRLLLYVPFFWNIRPTERPSSEFERATISSAHLSRRVAKPDRNAKESALSPNHQRLCLSPAPIIFAYSCALTLNKLETSDFMFHVLSVEDVLREVCGNFAQTDERREGLVPGPALLLKIGQGTMS